MVVVYEIVHKKQQPQRLVPTWIADHSYQIRFIPLYATNILLTAAIPTKVERRLELCFYSKPLYSNLVVKRGRGNF